MIWGFNACQYTLFPLIHVMANSAPNNHLIRYGLTFNSPVSQLFSADGDQPAKRILVHKSEQPNASCMQYFTNIAAIKTWGVMINLTLWNHLGILLKCQNTAMREYGAWIRISYVLCFKTYCIFGGLFLSPLVCNEPLDAHVFVRLAYWNHRTSNRILWYHGIYLFAKIKKNIGLKRYRCHYYLKMLRFHRFCPLCQWLNRLKQVMQFPNKNNQYSFDTTGSRPSLSGPFIVWNIPHQWPLLLTWFNFDIRKKE